MKMTHLTRTALFFLFSLIFFPAYSQVIDWKNHVEETYVYEISNKEAQNLLKKDPGKDIVKLLHTPRGSYTGYWTDEPKQGHFLKARIRQNKVYFDYDQVIPFQVFLFKEYGALTIQVTDGNGEIREDAKIHLERTRIDYDKVSRTYTYDDFWGEKEYRVLTVELDKFKAVFNLKKNFVPSWYGGSNRGGGRSPEFYSYMITDKNKYKPKETVRFKSYALTGKKKPIKDSLEVWMSTPDGYQYKKVSTVKPYNEGGFAGEILLHDSLKLRLDRSYYIQLRDKQGKITSSTSFRYEDYELYDSKLEVKLESNMHFSPDSNKLEIKATDVNGLYLLDTKADVTVFRNNVSKSYADILSLPDTLMSRRVDLAPSAPTIVSISPELFKESDCSYTVLVRVFTIDNQRLEAGSSANFYYTHNNIVATTHNDSIRFTYFNLGKEKSIRAKLSRNENGTDTLVNLPYQEKFNQKLNYYYLETTDPKLTKFVHTDDIRANLDLEGGIQKDSFNVKLVNPLDLELSWYIYQGNKLLEKGSGTEFDFKYPNTDLETAHYVEMFYYMGDEQKVFRRVFVPKTEYLNIDINLPERIYPGQKLDATITVKNNLGKPVSGVDLTAFAVNNLLNYHMYDLPYYGAPPKTREQKATFEIQDREYDYSMPLDYKLWNKIARLDEQDYYKFTYPWHRTFKHTVDTPDGTTQFAPYVMKNGESVAIHVIERNYNPVYFSWTEQPKTYSFPVPGDTYQMIYLRLHDRVIRLDSIVFAPGKKTILSIDLDHLPVNAKEMRIGSHFTSEEQNRYKKMISRLPVTNNKEYTLLDIAGQKYTIFHYCLSPSYRKDNILVGPLPQGMARYVSDKDKTEEYYHEGGFRYQFAGNVVYKYSDNVLTTPYYKTSLDFKNLNDFYLSPALIKKRIEDCQLGHNSWHPQNIYISEQNMVMNFTLPKEKDKSGVSNLLFLNKETQKVIFPDRLENSKRVYSPIPKGLYDVILLYNNGKYLKQENVPLERNTYLAVDMGKGVLCDADTISQKWLRLKSYSAEIGTARPVSTTDWRQGVRPARQIYGNTVTGVVVDSEGEPIIAASVVIKGTTSGCLTDLDGRFSIDIDGGESTLVISYIGYKTKEIITRPKTQVNIVLEEDQQLLEEVVVVGYGVQKKASLAASASVVRSDDLAASAPPEKLEDEDDDQVTADAEDKLYSEIMQLTGLRRNFSDVGFWQPSLVTDKKGKAEFEIIFPDNITKWDAIVYAMNRKLKTGTLRKSIRSFKPLMAELKTPQFMVVGDSAYFAAIVRNYTRDAQINGKVMFSIEADTLMQKNISFANSFSEKMLVEASATDSITTQYLFTRDDGYVDGEERSISVVPQGTEIAKGTLQFLRNGDQIQLQAQDNENIHVSITGKQLDVYVDASHYLTGYQYACNEQLASKLIGLLNYRIYMLYKEGEFKHDKNVREIIDRLLKNRNQQQLWSWWGQSSSTSYWMSSHIMRALKMAKDAGYEVNLNLQRITSNYADVSHYRGGSLYDIEVLHALSEWGTAQNYAEAVDVLEDRLKKTQAYDDSIVEANRKKYKNNWYRKRSFLKEKLLLLEIRQKQNLGYSSDSITKYMKKAILGEIYVDDDRQERYWYSDKLNNTLIAYRIIRNDSTLQHMRDAMQMYILGTKSAGWNTYQASSALATVFPDLISEGMSKDTPANIVISGKENKEVTKFPYTTVLQPGERLNIDKASGMPLIYTSYSYKRVTHANSGDAFEVSSSLNKDALVAGEPVTLTVAVDVKQDNAEHVMIEIPIPAGCSYVSKDRSYYGREVHREYFKERTVIFCESLPKGKYYFDVKLLPRYTGRYILNPAKVELMYFPVIGANNDMKKVSVEERD